MVEKFDDMIEITKSQKMKAQNNVHNTESQIDTLYKIKVKIEKIHKASKVELDTIENMGCKSESSDSAVCRFYDGSEGPCGKLGQKTIEQPKTTVTSTFSVPGNRQGKQKFLGGYIFR